MEKNFPIGVHVIPIILYADVILYNYLGKTSWHPVFMTLRNIPLAYQNKIDVKILLEYILRLKYCSTSEKNQPNIVQQHVNSFIRHL